MFTQERRRTYGIDRRLDMSEKIFFFCSFLSLVYREYESDFHLPHIFISDEFENSGNLARTEGIPALKEWPEISLAEDPSLLYRRD